MYEIPFTIINHPLVVKQKEDAIPSSSIFFLIILNLP